ncbi:MAG: undecaprenyl/decaprenyl-phosphate alpha-N-acetylglucosaminyl 1-phosphate transferase [Candidatus Cloacimonetes bacterium]|nr:undecaprenyl/decaprenyl-phosphate alpha-N-acetylglucosaminyl 1-phosphate transferase [Candidatus Cloacimonadota bacterium]MBS3766833.1 undecaprenyl/decaprenyl-phosphate alpha-N-acetylglucosaminyl 1-phosphate transferase [Candidatus Cloacimonadota bacterium]
MNHLLIFLTTFLFVYMLTFLIRKLATRWNFIDKPEERKYHTEPTALMGGIGVLLGILFGCCITWVICKALLPDSKFIISYLIGLVLVSLLGLYDDRYGLKPRTKFAIQALTALIFVFGAEFQGLLFNEFLSVPIFLFWMVGLMNALNFLDNMDGISSGIAAILSLAFFAVGILTGNHFLSLFSIIFIASCLGFLLHNFHPAKIFLGDAGSMLIGYTLGALGIMSVKQLIVDNGNINLTVLLPVLILSYAIFDISLVSLTRSRDGRYVFEGGKDHSTHRIGTATGSVRVTAIMVYLINIVVVLVSLIVYKTNDPFLTLIVTIIFAGSFLFFGDKLDKIPVVITKNQLKSDK